MFNAYSPSKIGTFDDCKLKYKYHYIDRLESDLETIEAFRGGRIHEALEEFYKLVKAGSIKDIKWLLEKYGQLWNKNYIDSIKIVKKELSAEDYLNKGRQALVDYYNRYSPFDQTKIVSTERMVRFSLKHDGREYGFRGILDRLDWNDKANMFEIHDYKVTNTLMTQEDVDTDWQLGLYHVALKEMWPDIEKVKLVWHSLLFNKELVSYRTREQLEGLKKELVQKVKEIEGCSNFSPRKSGLCDWCDFQNICPLWKHPKAMEEAPLSEYKNDSGVRLVSKYTELERAKNELNEKIHEIEKEQEEVKQRAIELAQAQDILVIDGPTSQLKIDIKDELRPPTRSEDPVAWQKLREILKKEGKYEEVSTVNSNMFSYRIRNRIWPADFVEKIKGFLRHQVTKTARLIKK